MSIIERLLNAKRQSDRRNYAAKHTIIRDLVRERPKEFVVDSEENGIVGVTHVPSGFRVHVPKNTISWYLAPKQAVVWAAVSAPVKTAIGHLAAALPLVRHRVYYNPLDDILHIAFSKSAAEGKVSRWIKRCEEVGFTVTASTYDEQPEGDRPWVLVKGAAEAATIEDAADPFIGAAARIAGFKRSPVTDVIGGPNPLTAMLATGLLGSGVGYLGGSLLERLLPNADFEQGRLRKNLAILGGILGAVPGIGWGVARSQLHPERSWWRNFLTNDASTMPAEPLPDKPLDGKAAIEKVANVRFGGQGLSDLDRMPKIHLDVFGNTVWRDDKTPLAIRSATDGLLTAAAVNSGSSLISPWNVAKVTATGAATGLLVGRTLGAMAGLKPQSQDALQRAGTWSGMLSTIVPIAFPRGTFG